MTAAIESERQLVVAHLQAIEARLAGVAFPLRAAVAATCVERQWPAFSKVCQGHPWRGPAADFLRRTLDDAWSWLEGLKPQPRGTAMECARLLDEAIADVEETPLSGALFISFLEFGMAIDSAAMPGQLIGIDAAPKDALNAVLAHARRLPDDGLGRVLLMNEMRRQREAVASLVGGNGFADSLAGLQSKAKQEDVLSP